MGDAATTRWARLARRLRVPLGFVLAAFYLWRARPTWTSLSIGTAIVLLGLIIRALAAGHIRKNLALTATGPYAHVRHPLYLGSLLLGIGFAIAGRDVWTWAAMLLLFLLIYVPVIRSEEAYLARQFPEYDDYARRVPALLPSRTSARELGSGFSRQLYMQHHEYNALLGAAAMLAALLIKIAYFAK